MALSSHDRSRLAKLLGMLGSNFDGEVVNAARAADRLIKNAGETWESVIIHTTTIAVSYQPHTRQREYRAPPAPEHWEEVKKYQAYTTVLNAWEAKFLESIGLRHSLSEKQQKVLARIRAKIEQYEKYKDSEW